MTTTDLAPLGLQDTPDSMSPCAACGLPTTGPTTAYPVHGRIIGTPEVERFEEMRAGSTIDLPTCGACRDIEATAKAIIARHGSVGGARGSVAVWQTTAALYGLIVTGRTLPGPDIPHDRLTALVHRMSVPGAGVAYSRRFSPVWERGASTKHSARAPWSGANAEMVAACRAAALDWFVDSRPLRPMEKPDGGRCQWCGTATSPGRRLSEAWTGDHCASCAAIRDGGDDFQDAVWQAIDRNRAIRRRTPHRPAITGLVPWSQSRRGDGAPWSHLGGVEALRESVKALLATL